MCDWCYKHLKGRPGRYSNALSLLFRLASIVKTIPRRITPGQGDQNVLFIQLRDREKNLGPRQFRLESFVESSLIRFVKMEYHLIIGPRDLTTSVF